MFDRSHLLEIHLRNSPEIDFQLKTGDVPEVLDPFFSSQVNKTMDPDLNNPLTVWLNISEGINHLDISPSVLTNITHNLKVGLSTD